MSCVAAIALSGLFLYWEHVDGPSQLFTTMYGRVLGVKILIFGTLLLLGIVNQFWLHPRIEALRAAGDDRPLRVLLVREFRVTVGVELLLLLSVLFVAPFLQRLGPQPGLPGRGGQARDLGHGKKLPKIAAKEVSGSTWAWGITETIVVIAIMVAGYYVIAAASPGAGPPRRPRPPRPKLSSSTAEPMATAPAGKGT